MGMLLLMLPGWVNRHQQDVIMHLSALRDTNVTPEEKAQVMGGNLLRLLADNP